MFNSATHEFAKKIKRPRKLVDHLNKETGDSIFDDLEDSTNNFHLMADIAERAVRKLGAADKVIFDFMLEGLNIKQISERTGVNRQYVSEMIKRIRTDLQSQIRKSL
jgi:DNA-directed RNA polymerase specialized sigma24 family protein